MSEEWEENKQEEASHEASEHASDASDAQTAESGYSAESSAQPDHGLGLTDPAPNPEPVYPHFAQQEGENPHPAASDPAPSSSADSAGYHDEYPDADPSSEPAPAPDDPNAESTDPGHYSSPLPDATPSVPETLSFAIFDIRRGITQLRNSSAAGLPGTVVHTAILHFEAAIARMDRALAQHSGVGEHNADGSQDEAHEQQVAAQRVKYEREYMDRVPPVPGAGPGSAPQNSKPSEPNPEANVS